MANKQESLINLALFGAGRIGSHHFANLLTNEHARVSHVVECDVSLAKRLIDRYRLHQGVKAVHMNCMTEIMDNPAIDGVMVCTPPATHTAIVQAALNSGKPVFCEKPIALSVEEARQLYALAEEKKTPLMCGFQRRYDPQCRQVWNAVRSGKIGRVRAIKLTSRDPPGLNAKDTNNALGGIFLESCIHDLDMALWMAGEYPHTIYATGHANAPKSCGSGDIDTAAVTMTFPGGAVAQIEMSRNTHVGYDQRVEILGSEGMLQSENKRAKEVVEYQLERVHLEPIYTCFTERYQQAYCEEVRQFIDIIRGKAVVEVSGSDVITATVIAHACQHSVQTKQVVDLRAFAKENFSYEISP